METDEILRLLPHRPPMLMVDRVIEMEPGVRGVATKLVTSSEPWVPGHFPGSPIMPGVLIVEALAQTAALVYLAAHPDKAGEAVYLVGMDGFRFRRMVRPGDVLRLTAEATKARRGFWSFTVEATVDGQRASSGTFLATVGSR